MSLSFACPDWWDRLQAGQTPIPDLPLDEKLATKAVTIFNKLRLPDVPGQPTLGEAGGEWARDIVRAIFGSMQNGVRLVGEVMAMVPKKNSKTTNGAAFSIVALMMNERPRAELIYVGPTQEVADTAFQQAVGMIEADPYLSQRFKVADHKKTITDLTNQARLKIKTFDLKVVTGSKPVFVLLDEIHLMGIMSAAIRIMGQIRGGLLPNPESCLVVITTQSDDVPSGLWAQELAYARKVRDGKVTENVRLLAVLYEFPESIQQDEDQPWKNPDLWAFVTPNLNRSITLDALIADFQMAKEKGDEELRRWASQHLNLQIGMALAADRWAGADHWLKAADTSITLDALVARCEVVTVGIDGGGLDDLFGLSVCGRCKTTRNWLFWFHAWCQRDVLNKRKSIAPRLLEFEEEGSLTIVPDDDVRLDFREAANIIRGLNEGGMLPDEDAVGCDPVGIAEFVDNLTSADNDNEDLEGTALTFEQVKAVPQGYRLNSAIKGFERKLKDGSAQHDGSKMMIFVVSNAKATMSGSAVVITKQVSGTGKIDPLIAGFNAFQFMARNPQPSNDGAVDDYFASMKAAS